MILSIDLNVNQIHYYYDIKLLNKDLVDIVLNTSWNSEMAKGHNLKFKIVIFTTKSYLLQVTFSNQNLMIGIYEILLSEVLGPT